MLVLQVRLRRYVLNVEYILVDNLRVLIYWLTVVIDIKLVSPAVSQFRGSPYRLIGFVHLLEADCVPGIDTVW